MDSLNSAVKEQGDTTVGSLAAFVVIFAAAEITKVKGMAVVLAEMQAWYGQGNLTDAAVGLALVNGMNIMSAMRAALAVLPNSKVKELCARRIEMEASSAGCGPEAAALPCR